MSIREMVLYALILCVATIVAVMVSLGCNEDAHLFLVEAIGFASALAWSFSAMLYRRARLAARISLLAAALAGEACVVAVTPAEIAEKQTSIGSAARPPL
jgi:hypothetical protein